MQVVRRLVVFCLAAVMVMTSGAMALSRTAPDGQTIVICTGSEVSTITVDRNGNEIAPMPICPDCLVLKAVLENIVPFTRAQYVLKIRYVTAQKASSALRPFIAADARGPPVQV